MQRFLLTWSVLTCLCVISHVSAHATIVLGEVTPSPITPAPGESFNLRLSLEDPLGTPIEDAIVAVEFRPLAEVHAVDPPPTDSLNAVEALIISPETEAQIDPVRSEFREVSPGIYETRSQLNGTGPFHMLFRDTTYRQEEARAVLVFEVTDDIASTQNDAMLSFLFPPTAIGPQFLWLWVFLLIGLPLFAAGVVTVMVLRHAKKKDALKAPAAAS
ncbi:MAG: hypothetical protein AAF267_11165 [Deinococcota bacterium]